MTAEQRIQNLLDRHAPGAKLAHAKPLHGGISATMTAFQIEGDPKTYSLRQVSDWTKEHNPLAATHEYQLLQQLMNQNLKVPNPKFLDQDHDQYVVEFIEGQPNLNPINLPEHLERYAFQLAQIHQAKTENLAFLPRQTIKPILQPENPNRRLGEDVIRQALSLNQPSIHLNEPVLRHGDYWPGNILWQDEHITGVIDWEGASIGEPLADLGAARLDVLWVYGEEAMNAFTELYHGHATLNRTSQPYWDLLASIRCINDFERMAPAYPLLGRPDVTVQTLEDGLAVFVAQALSEIR